MLKGQGHLKIKTQGQQYYVTSDGP